MEFVFFELECAGYLLLCITFSTNFLFRCGDEVKSTFRSEIKDLSTTMIKQTGSSRVMPDCPCIAFTAMH